MSQDQDRANAFLKRLVAQTKAVHHPLTDVQTKPTVLVRREGVPEDFSQQITPRRQRKLQGNVFQRKRRYHNNYQTETSLPEHSGLAPTRLDRLATIANNDVDLKTSSRYAYRSPLVTGGEANRDAQIRTRNYLNLNSKVEAEAERQGRSRGVEWMRQIRNIPAPTYRRDSSTNKIVKNPTPGYERYT